MSIPRTKGSPVPERSSAEKLEAVLRKLRRRVPQVRGSAIADKNGLPMACDLPPKVNAMMATAMSAFAMQSSRSITSNLGLQPAERLTTECPGSMIVVKSISGGAASLFAILTGNVDSERIKSEMDLAAREAEEVLGA